MNQVLGIGVHTKSPEKAKKWLTNLKLTIPYCVGFLTNKENFTIGEETVQETSEGPIRSGKYNGIDYFILSAPRTEPSLRNKFYNITNQITNFYTFLNDNAWPVNITNEILNIFSPRIGAIYSDLLISNTNSLYLFDVWPCKAPYYITTGNALRGVNGYQLASGEPDVDLLNAISKTHIIYHVPEILFVKEIQ